MSDAPIGRIPPPAFLGWPAPAAVLAALPGARVVGGAVRDALAGREVADVDVATPFPPEEVARRLAVAGLRVHETGLAHGTLTATLNGVPVEVTSLRRDVLTDGRHATVAWTTDWREDSARRDFTMNAMSLSADGALWDHHGGRDDLAMGRVRFVGDPATRLREDHLRALRWFRFQARYGRGEPDAAALGAIEGAVPSLAGLSAERVWSEVKRVLAAPDPVGAVALMRATGVLRAILPEATEEAVLARLVALGAPADALLRLAALLRAGVAVARLAMRLRLSSDEAERLDALGDRRGLPRPNGGGPPLAVWRATSRLRRAEDARGALWLAEARDGVDRTALRAAVVGDAPMFPLHGRDMLALGAPPGPEVGRVLGLVREWWLAGGCVADAAACRARLRGVIADIAGAALHPPGGAG